MGKLLFWFIYFGECVLARGMGSPPWHRWNSIFKIAAQEKRNG